jgi:hypothetical protein
MSGSAGRHDARATLRAEHSGKRGAARRAAHNATHRAAHHAAHNNKRGAARAARVGARGRAGWLLQMHSVVGDCCYLRGDAATVDIIHS